MYRLIRLGFNTAYRFLDEYLYKLYQSHHFLLPLSGYTLQQLTGKTPSHPHVDSIQFLGMKG